MANLLRSWVDDRTAVPSLLQRAASEPVRGGARFRYVFGSALAGAFLLQVVTGLLLMSAYVPSAGQAWGSVWYINTQLAFGWFIRGLHHFGSSAVVILLAMHLAQTILLAAYRAPREFNWWLGLILMQFILGLALTGYLLPWDQKGYWATRVATGIAGSTPVLGPYIQTVVVGGSEYGNQTLTHLYSLHVGVLPALIFFTLLGHYLLARRHQLTASRAVDADARTESYWPSQSFFNWLGIAIVLGLLTAYVLYEHGAPLDAPADASSTDYPARPEWYFLFLYQLLNEFESPYEIVGTMIIPGAVMTVLFLLPLLDKVLPRGLVHFGASAFIFVLLGGAGFLMTKAVLLDLDDPAFQAARVKHTGLRHRADLLASVEGVPPDGAVYILRRDPLTQGRAVLESKCLSCHAFQGKGQSQTVVSKVTADDLSKAVVPPGTADASSSHVRAAFSRLSKPTAVSFSLADTPATFQFSGTSEDGTTFTGTVPADGTSVALTTYSKPTASDLDGFGTRAWLRGLLENPSDPKYFGLVPQATGMKGWKEETKLTPEQLDQVADFFETHVIHADPLVSPLVWEASEAVTSHPGYTLFTEDCGKCHAWGQGGTDSTGVDAPNLYAWGTPAWSRRMIESPGAVDLYGYLPPEHQMPPFLGQITDSDFRAMLRFLSHDYVPESGPAPAADTSTSANSPE